MLILNDGEERPFGLLSFFGVVKCCFFFSSRRRHTRYWRDWSSDVCSSDLVSTPFTKVSIIPRGIGSLGYTIQRPTEDRFLMTREELENKMAVSLGGRAAELIEIGRGSCRERG